MRWRRAGRMGKGRRKTANPDRRLGQRTPPGACVPCPTLSRADPGHMIKGVRAFKTAGTRRRTSHSAATIASVNFQNRPATRPPRETAVGIAP